MRSLKFRAWDKQERKWVTEEYGIYPDGQPFTQMGGTKDCENYILMQYTGLKDKNGVEIYENDIIQSSDANKTIFKIWFWCWGLAGQKATGGNWGFTAQPFDENLDFDTVPNWEVIGNVYENPGLMEAL